jgi:glycerophosphoryl diester phosphodiesterase
LAQEIIERAHCAGLDGLDLNHKGPITPEFMKKARAAGLKVFVWTIDDVASAQNMIDLGADAIATNRPAWLREQLTATLQPSATSV